MDPLSVLPEILPHAVRVMAFFPPGQRTPGKYRTFEYLVFVQTNAPSVASNRALSVLRSVRDNPEVRKKLGTREKPLFYAVVWVGYVELPDDAPVPYEHPMIINYFTVEKQEVEVLKADGKACFPVRLHYIEDE